MLKGILLFGICYLTRRFPLPPYRDCTVFLYRATLKAVDAAVSSRQWLKAVQILEVLPMKPEVQKYYKKIAQHHANMGEYEVQIYSVQLSLIVLRTCGYIV